MTTNANSVNLAAASIAAEKASFGIPTWTTIATASNDILTATTVGIAGKQHFLTHVTLSFSGTVAAATTLTVKDGSTVIWQVEINTAIAIFTENFETRPLHASVGANLVVGVGAGGTGITGTISAAGFTIVGP